MRFYRYWVREEGELLIDGMSRKAGCYGRSDLSEEHARQQAKELLAALQTRIDKGQRRLEGYETSIREEVVRVVDDRNLISRNRYGAEVLNSEHIVFVDIDRVRGGVLNGLKRLLFGPRKQSMQDRIVEMVERQAARPEYRDLGIRIYATHSGVRLIVTGRDFAPDSAAVAQLFRDFQADHLYAWLCARQKCYRARLTPKPSRMKCRGFKVSFPRSAEEEAALQTWLADYRCQSDRFAVCKLLKVLGLSHSHPVISLHDSLTKAGSRLNLA
jgi:hypothetical protein